MLIYVWYRRYYPMVWPYPWNPHVEILGGDVYSGDIKNWGDIATNDFLAFSEIEGFENWEPYGLPPKEAWEPVWDSTPQNINETSATLKLFGVDFLGWTPQSVPIYVRNETEIWSRTFDFSTWTIQGTEEGTGATNWVVDHCMVPSDALFGFFGNSGYWGTGTGITIVFRPA